MWPEQNLAIGAVFWQYSNSGVYDGSQEQGENFTRPKIADILPGAKPVCVLNGQKSPLSSLDGLTFIPVYFAYFPIIFCVKKTILLDS